MYGSHSDSNRIPTGNYDSEVGSQSSDSRTWERRKVGVAIEKREPEAGYQENITKCFQWCITMITMYLKLNLTSCLLPSGHRNHNVQPVYNHDASIHNNYI